MQVAVFVERAVEPRLLEDVGEELFPGLGVAELRGIVFPFVRAVADLVQDLEVLGPRSVHFLQAFDERTVLDDVEVRHAHETVVVRVDARLDLRLKEDGDLGAHFLPELRKGPLGALEALETELLGRRGGEVRVRTRLRGVNGSEHCLSPPYQSCTLLHARHSSKL